MDAKVTGDWLVFAGYMQELGVKPQAQDLRRSGNRLVPDIADLLLAGGRAQLPHL